VRLAKFPVVVKKRQDLLISYFLIFLFVNLVEDRRGLKKRGKRTQTDFVRKMDKV
jgi:hypothetical protein